MDTEDVIEELHEVEQPTQKKKYKHCVSIKGATWNEYQKKYCYILTNKKLPSETIEKKVSDMKNKIAELEKILHERKAKEEANEQEIAERQQLVLLMQKYNINN